MVETITQRSDDFTARDFDSWILELRSRATAAFPSWTDFNRANFGNILLEMFAHTLDVFSFTQDQQLKETRIAWARLLRSMIHLGKNFGYDLPGASVATADLEITIADNLPRAADIVIPAGTVVKTQDTSENIEFDLIADATIPSGSIQVTGASAENARAQVYSFVTDGTPSQSFTMPATPYVDGSSAVVVGVDIWTEQDDLFNSGPSDKHYTVDLDENDRGTIRFGDGTNGAIPSGSSIATYKTGGGEVGNVEANTLQVFRDGNRFATLTGEQVQLLVRNPADAGGGVDRMGVEEARVAIPASLRTIGNRSVTQQDFEDNARKTRGVARSMMLTADDDSAIPENEGRLYIVPVGGGLPSTLLKTQVHDSIMSDYPPCLTFTFQVEDPVLKIVSFVADVYLNPGITYGVARTAVDDAFDSFFSLLNSDGSENSQIDFGYKVRARTGETSGTIPWSDLFNVIRDAADPSGNLVFRKVDEDTFIPTGDVVLGDTEFPVLGSILLTDAATSTPIP